MSDLADFWTSRTSVFFSSFWGWSPETWGCVGWTGADGEARRNNLLAQLTDPFIAVIYVTRSTDEGDLAGKIVGFYLMSHDTGHRNDFTHPQQHALEPEKWIHSLRALRAFTYLPEYRLNAQDFDPDLARRARAVTKWGEVIRDPKQIAKLRTTPWVEVDVYGAGKLAVEAAEELYLPARGFNRAGPANRNGYVVSTSALNLKRQLYILRLAGEMDAFLGRAVDGRCVYKIGLSASPDLRRQSLQSALPECAFHWTIYRTTFDERIVDGFSFDAAVAGEDEMKRYLSTSADWLGGEFYLASEDDIEVAWERGCTAARNFGNA